MQRVANYFAVGCACVTTYIAFSMARMHQLVLDARSGALDARNGSYEGTETMEAIFPNLPQIPWGLLLIAIGLTFFLTQKFRDKIPDIFKPSAPALTPEQIAAIAAKAAMDAVKEAMNTVTITKG